MSTILYYSILFYTILYYTILYHTILFYSILYYSEKGRMTGENASVSSLFNPSFCYLSLFTPFIP